MMKRRRPFWQFSAREARVHALLVACVLWIGAAALMVSGSGYRDALGQLKGTDFVHFYTLGHIAANGPAGDLLDADRLYQRQVALVPASAPERYLPIYPPHTALLFVPLSNLPYGWALAACAVMNAAVYGGALWLAWLWVRPVGLDVPLVFAAAAAFPPFWNLVLHGQSTFAPIIAFTLGTWALMRGHHAAAGAAFGLLLLKPQFALMLPVVVLVSRDWAMLGGAVVSVLAQAGLAAAVFGPDVLARYIAFIPTLPSLQGALEPAPGQVHDLSALTDLLPGPLGVAAWLVSSAWVAYLTLRVWRSALPFLVRMAAVVLGSALVNLHLHVYDLAVVAAPMVWVAGWLESDATRSNLRQQWWAAVYLWYALLLLPSAYFIGVQGSVLVLLWFLVALARTARTWSLVGGSAKLAAG